MFYSNFYIQMVKKIPFLKIYSFWWIGDNLCVKRWNRILTDQKISGMFVCHDSTFEHMLEASYHNDTLLCLEKYDWIWYWPKDTLLCLEKYDWMWYWPKDFRGHASDSFWSSPIYVNCRTFLASNQNAGNKINGQSHGPAGYAVHTCVDPSTDSSWAKAAVEGDMPNAYCLHATRV